MDSISLQQGLLGNEEGEEGNMLMNTSAEQKLRKSMEKQIKKFQKLDNKQNVQEFQENFISKNYTHINSKVEKMRFQNPEGPSEFKVKTTEKVLINRRVLNDYIHIVNKRQDVVDQIEDNFWTMVQLYDSTLHYFNKYYGKKLEDKMDKLKHIIKPEHRYMLRGIVSNERRIKQRILEYEQARNSSDPRLKKALEECKNIEDIVHQNQDAIRQRTLDRHNKQKQEGHIEKLSKKKGYIANDAIPLEEIRQNQMVLNEVQKFGSDRIKRQLFEEDMKTLLENKEIQDKIHKIQQSLEKMNTQQSQQNIQQINPKKLQNEDDEDEEDEEEEQLGFQSRFGKFSKTLPSLYALEQNKNHSQIHEYHNSEVINQSPNEFVQTQSKIQSYFDPSIPSHQILQNQSAVQTSFDNHNPFQHMQVKSHVLDHPTANTLSQVNISQNNLNDSATICSINDLSKSKSAVSFMLPSQSQAKPNQSQNLILLQNFSYNTPNKESHYVNGPIISPKSKQLKPFPAMNQSYHEIRKASLQSLLTPNPQNKRPSLAPLKPALKKSISEKNQMSLMHTDNSHLEFQNSNQEQQNQEISNKMNSDDPNRSLLTSKHDSEIQNSRPTSPTDNDKGNKNMSFIGSINDTMSSIGSTNKAQKRLTTLISSEGQQSLIGHLQMRKKSKFNQLDCSESIIEDKELTKEEEPSKYILEKDHELAQIHKTQQNNNQESDETEEQKGTKDSKTEGNNSSKQKPLIRNKIYIESDIFKYKKINQYVISEYYDKKILNLQKDETPMLTPRELEEIEEDKKRKSSLITNGSYTRNKSFWNTSDKKGDILGIEKEKIPEISQECHEKEQIQIQKHHGQAIANLYDDIQKGCSAQMQQSKFITKDLKNSQKEFTAGNKKLSQEIAESLSPKKYKSIYVEQILNQTKKQLNLKPLKRKFKAKSSSSPDSLLQNLLKQDKKVHAWGKNIGNRSQDSADTKKYSLISNSVQGIKEIEKTKKEKSLEQIAQYIQKVKDSPSGQDLKHQLEQLMTLDSKRKSLFQMTQKKTLPNNIQRNKQKNQYISNLLSNTNINKADLTDIVEGSQGASNKVGVKIDQLNQQGEQTQVS